MTSADLARFLKVEVPRIKKHAAEFPWKDAHREDEAALLSALDAAVGLLREAATGFEYLSRYGFASSKIPCPEDYNFYVKPMRDSAQRAADTLRLVVGQKETS